MNSRLPLIIIACGMASLASAADTADKQAEAWISNFKKADLDYSGGLSKSELDKTGPRDFRSIKRLFDKMDANRDGQVTPREYADLVQKRRDAWLATVKKADLNDSGGLSRAELDKTKPSQFKRLKSSFDAMDSNRDGQVSVAEFDGYKPAPTTAATPAVDWQAAFKKADLNDSGGLSKTELGQASALGLDEMKLNFDQIDANKDGHLTGIEYQDYLAEQDDDEEDTGILSFIGKLFK